MELNELKQQLAECRDQITEVPQLMRRLAECERERDRWKDNYLRNDASEFATVTKERDELVRAIERMRVAGGSHEFHMAFELAKDALAKLGADKTGEKTSQIDSHWPTIKMDISEGVCGTCKLGAENCDVDLDGHCGGLK